MKLMQLKNMRGVTLMELLVVVVIIGILASVAVPSYRRYLLRSQRTEAMTALMNAQTAQEKFFLQFNAYSNNLTAAPPAGLGLLNRTATEKFAVTLARPTVTTFTVTATAIGGQMNDDTCRVFTINQAGTRRAFNESSDERTDECWR